MLSKQQPKLRKTKMELLNSSNASDPALPQQQQQEVVDNQEEEEEEQVHVLAVDDSLIDRKVLEKLLTVSSYQVTCVDSGDKALKYLGLIDSNDNNRDLKVNLIMTDYCMPGMSGYDLLKRVKESTWKDVPVVVMSSENVPSRISMCMEEGAEEFLLKPLQLADVEKLHPCLHLKSHNATKTNPNHQINCNNIKKRKAISPSHRRTKIKGPLL